MACALIGFLVASGGAHRRERLCELLWEAADAASVRSVQHEAGAVFERIWPADVLDAGTQA